MELVAALLVVAELLVVVVVRLLDRSTGFTYMVDHFTFYQKIGGSQAVAL
jgi:hypothetical protein